MKKIQITYLSLGSNLGDKIKNLQKAINLIEREIGDIQKISSVYKTASWGFESNDFYNLCIKVSTSQSPEMVMTNVLKTENELGRNRDCSKNYTDRSIDIDILLFGNQIISKKNLVVPHPRMLERKFVLVPLSEIAKNVLHPVEKKQIKVCLQNCKDSSDVSKIDKKLSSSMSISKKYNYIVIEGNIGSGKTSLAKMISKEMNAKLILERFEENPFLSKFYQDKKRYAFPLEMSFLVDRYQQLNESLMPLDLSKELVISDYYVFKSLIFAQITLSKDEYALYKKIVNLMYKEVEKPDLYVYLHQNTDRLLDNIKKRGRDYEQNIQPTYLQKIHEGYTHFIETENSSNTLIVDVSEIDFIKKNTDYKHIIDKIQDF